MQDLGKDTAVVVASYDRRDVLGSTLESILGQQLLPNRVFVAVTSEAHVTDKWRRHPRVTVLRAARGQGRQLNAAFAEALLDHQYIAEFDDDVELHPEYLRRTVEALAQEPDVLALTGCPVADGCITREQAIHMLSAHPARETNGVLVKGKGHNFHLYGCNIVFRREALRLENYDIELPDSGYMNDLDLSIRLCRHGLIGCHTGALLVHLQSNTWRPRGHRFGYCQVAVPFYLRSKGVLKSLEVSKLLTSLICANFYHWIRGDSQIDRRGRLVGNGRGIIDLVSFRLSLDRIEKRYPI